MCILPYLILKSNVGKGRFTQKAGVVRRTRIAGSPNVKSMPAHSF